MKFSMLFLNKLVGINSFIVFDNLYCLKSGSLFVYTDEFDYKIKEFDATVLTLVSTYVFSDENLYVDTFDFSVYRIEELNGYYFSGIYKHDILLYTSKNIVFYSFVNKRIINNVNFFDDGSVCMIFDDKYLVNGENYYSLYDIITNDLKWEFNIEKLLKTTNSVTQTGEIVVYDNRLFIYLYDDEDMQDTIVLDLETGNELYRTSNFKGYIRLQEDKIYALYGKSVSIMDPDTFLIRKIDLTDELAVLDVTFEEFVDTGESIGLTTRWFNFSPRIYEVHYPYLYFAQERGAQVGIVNLETEKLEWHTTIDIDYPINPVVKDIKACEERLYVHCADNTLHVFERE